MPAQLSQQQLAVVLRRAAELERRRHAEASGEQGLSDAELEELVREVGIPSEDVARALTELRAGALPMTATRRTLADRLVGPAEAASERIVRGDAPTVERRVAEFLRSQLLEVRRDFGDRVQWGTAPGFLAKARRALDFSGRISLPTDVLVESLVAPLPGASGQVIVRLVLRAGELRVHKLQNMATSLAAGGALAALGIAVASGTPELVAVGLGASAGIGGVLSARGSYRRTIAGATLALERFLDTLEHGERRGAA